MDDLIVIILTLLVAGFSLWGQAKKKKQIAEGSEGRTEPENLWDLLGREIEEPFPESESTGDEEIVEPIDVVPEKTDYRFQPESEGKSLIQKEKKNQESKEPVTSKPEKFSLKKAVIYSEILNRKYI